MKAYCGSGCVAPLIRYPRHYLENSDQLQAGGGSLSPSGRGGEEKNSQPSPRIVP
jgi:hypothetical protein